MPLHFFLRFQSDRLWLALSQRALASLLRAACRWAVISFRDMKRRQGSGVKIGMRAGLGLANATPYLRSTIPSKFRSCDQLTRTGRPLRCFCCAIGRVIILGGVDVMYGGALRD